MKTIKPPLPFLGNKRNALKNYKKVLIELKEYGLINENTLILDLYGGSGLLSHVAKQMLPYNEVIWNDYDNYQERLNHIADTEKLRQDLKDFINLNIKDAPDHKKPFTKKQKVMIITFLSEYEKNNYIDFITLSSCNDYIFIDNATSLNEVADNRAVVTIGVEKFNESVRFIVKDCKFGIWSEEETIKNIIETMLNYKNANVYIESDGGGLTLNRLLQREIIIINERLKRQDKDIIHNTINVYTPSRKISKVEKIKAIRSYYNSGGLVFLYGAKGLEQIKKELLSFNPEKPFRKDDCIDCIASCIAHKDISAPYKAENKTQNLNRHYSNSKGWRV